MRKNSTYEVFQRSLITARRNKNLTQAQLAILLNRPQSFVCKYEIGERRLDVIEFIEVCRVLSISPEIFIREMINQS
ncbi:helix-turn-helix domain-containing protein [Acinetobacter baumannii]|uniref:helix-turn-helix domain-containing protein n=1 Tax=Acinetobacter baumannii TaxID=470 RepID=UPI000DE721A1|nr:helix-turn-helix transcriptional regulator [Acinetobacter baumannii]MCZ3107191.1 helix-turn-helix domain-containing protein [Acinetobacter baumannii]MDA3554519.1 helix-turn-helix domain-containing protein [Acinetobacter baumannii]RSF30016.1 XRE family transcriptional regulator [Acinetobacter baumannii]SSR04355.1 Helix-turn-helix family protein [Acinetobacter baumannii]